MKNIHLFLMVLLLGVLSNRALGEIVIHQNPSDTPVESAKTPISEEDGVLSPKKREHLNGSNPDKAPSYVLQQRDSVLIVVPMMNGLLNPNPNPNPVPSTGQYQYEQEISRRNTLERNRDRARAYSDQSQNSQGSQNPTKTRMASGVMGKDGVVVFPCTHTTGSIHHDGESFKSGSIFFINLNGKSVKARCH